MECREQSKRRHRRQPFPHAESRVRTAWVSKQPHLLPRVDEQQQRGGRLDEVRGDERNVAVFLAQNRNEARIVGEFGFLRGIFVEGLMAGCDTAGYIPQ